MCKLITLSVCKHSPPSDRQTDRQHCVAPAFRRSEVCLPCCLVHCHVAESIFYSIDFDSRTVVYISKYVTMSKLGRTMRKPLESLPF